MFYAGVWHKSKDERKMRASMMEFGFWMLYRLLTLGV